MLFVALPVGGVGDAGLLDMLAAEKLREVAEQVQAEGWKWTEPHIDYPHAHGIRRFYPQSVPLSDEIDAISAKRFAYDANVIAHGGAFVVLHHDGSVRIERGFFRAEDEALADPQPEPAADGDPTPASEECCSRKRFRSAMRQGFPEIELWTFAGPDAARHLYEISGFTLVEERRGTQWGTEVMEQRYVRHQSKGH